MLIEIDEPGYQAIADVDSDDLAAALTQLNRARKPAITNKQKAASLLDARKRKLIAEIDAMTHNPPTTPEELATFRAEVARIEGEYARLDLPPVQGNRRQRRAQLALVGRK
jgi:hypothetical protein